MVCLVVDCRLFAVFVPDVCAMKGQIWNIRNNIMSRRGGNFEVWWNEPCSVLSVPALKSGGDPNPTIILFDHVSIFAGNGEEHGRQR